MVRNAKLAAMRNCFPVFLNIHKAKEKIIISSFIGGDDGNQK